MQFFKCLHPFIKQTDMEPIQLSIPTPCHESWDKMTPNQQGRFCGSCAKTVVDFSAMTDAQLIHYFEHLKNENVCGRVYPDQLNRNLQKPQPIGKRKKLYRLWQYAAALVLFFTKGAQVKAQGEIKGKVAPKADTIKRPVEIPVRLGGIRRVDVPPTVHVLPALITQLFITDENNNPIQGASVQLLPSEKWVATDSTGKINLGKSHAVKEVKVSAVGFESRQVLLEDVKGNSIQLNRNLATLGEVAVQCSVTVGRLRRTTGAVSIITADEIKKSSPLLTTGIPSAASFNIFPNPVQKGKEISFTVTAKDKKKYKILISNADGKIMLQQNVGSSAKGQPAKMNLPALWNSGMYIMSLVSENGETIQSEKIMLL